MQIRNVLLVAGAASFSTRDVWDGYHKGLVQAGVNVVAHPTFSMLRMLSPDLIGNDIIGKAADHRNAIDAVLFIDGLYFRHRRQWVPRTLKKMGIPTILLATDDPYEEIENSSSNYTLRFTNEICSSSRQIFYLPTAACEPKQASPGREFDVVFIGTIFEERAPLLKAMAHYCADNRLRCLIAGSLTKEVAELRDLDCVTIQKNVIGAEAKWKLYSSAKVVLNVFRDCESPVQSPNPRVFEVTAMGQPALLTGPPRTEVQRIFGDSVYHFDGADSMLSQLKEAIDNDGERQLKVARAKQITTAGHMYVHRAEDLISTCRSIDLEAAETFPAEEKTAWIHGCGRSGSTWLSDMLGKIDGMQSWHEPMFGKLFHFLQANSSEHDRRRSIFYSGNANEWLSSMRDSFNRIAASQFPDAADNEALIVKDVNAPEACPYLREVFPHSRFILLLRDPFDVLDSFLDMQRPGGWNEDYSGETNLADQARISCQNIQRSIKLALLGYENYPSSQRLTVRYEEMLDDPARILMRCAELVGVNLPSKTAETIAKDGGFANYLNTGRLKHRRFGRAGVWRESENFTDEVRKIADDILGGIRTHLEYVDQ